MKNWEGCGEKQLWPNVSFCPGVCLQRLQTNHEKTASTATVPTYNRTKHPQNTIKKHHHRSQQDFSYVYGIYLHLIQAIYHRLWLVPNNTMLSWRIKPTYWMALKSSTCQNCKPRSKSLIYHTLYDHTTNEEIRELIIYSLNKITVDCVRNWAQHLSQQHNTQSTILIHSKRQKKHNSTYAQIATSTPTKTEQVSSGLHSVAAADDDDIACKVLALSRNTLPFKIRGGYCNSQVRRNPPPLYVIQSGLHQSVAAGCLQFIAVNHRQLQWSDPGYVFRNWLKILVNNQHDALFSMYLFISLLYMFWATLCSSSGELNCVNTSSGSCHSV